MLKRLAQVLNKGIVAVFISYKYRLFVQEWILYKPVWNC